MGEIGTEAGPAAPGQAGALAPAREATASEKPQIPEAKVPAPIRWLANLMRSSAGQPQRRDLASGIRADGTAPAALPPLVPQDPEAVLGATKAVVSVLAEIAGENKGIAVAGGVLFLAGLGIYALMRHSAARKKRGEAGLEQGPPRPSMAERYAEVRNTRDLQAPQYGRRASQTERWPYS